MFFSFLQSLRVGSSPQLEACWTGYQRETRFVPSDDASDRLVILIGGFGLSTNGLFSDFSADLADILGVRVLLLDLPGTRGNYEEFRSADASRFISWMIGELPDHPWVKEAQKISILAFSTSALVLAGLREDEHDLKLLQDKLSGLALLSPALAYRKAGNKYMSQLVHLFCHQWQLPGARWLFDRLWIRVPVPRRKSGLPESKKQVPLRFYEWLPFGVTSSLITLQRKAHLPLSSVQLVSQVPCLIVYGERDGKVDCEYVSRWADSLTLLTEVTKTSLSKTGHALPLGSDVELLRSAVTTWLKHVL